MYYQQPGYRHLHADRRKHKIRVFGEGKVTAEPDQAKVTLGAVTEDISLEAAQRENAEIISAIKSALNTAGIPDNGIQTINYSIFPQYDYVDGKQEFRGYRVEHMLQITVKDIDSVGMIVDTAVKNGANQVSGIQFSVEDTGAYQQHALSLAVADAYEKAETIAKTLGVTLNPTPLKVSETAVGEGGPIPYQTTAFVKAAATTPIQPGTLEIQSQVTAEFEY